MKNSVSKWHSCNDKKPIVECDWTRFKHDSFVNTFTCETSVIASAIQVLDKAFSLILGRLMDWIW